MTKIVLLLLVICSIGGRAVADTRDAVPGPINALVIEVVDGDTLRVRARIWPHQQVETLVRLDGVNTPELKGNCPAERDLALRARRFVETRLGLAEPRSIVSLHDIRFDKYGGRVLARVTMPSGEDLGTRLLREGLAEPYKGARRKSWCETETP